jgi:anaerobic selenocysteine-containing dehydrogenase
MLSIPFAHAGKPIMKRADGVLDDWEIFWDLARRMGRRLVLKRPMFGAPHDHIPGPELELDPDVRPDTGDIVRWMTSQGSTDYDSLIAHPHGTVVEICRAQVTPAGPDDGARLDLCPADVAKEIREVYRRSENHALPEYPFRLIVRRMLESMNSAYHNASKTRRRHPVNPAYMSPVDMKILNLSEDDTIEIVSPYGSVVARPKPDAGLRQGVVSMTHGWGSIDGSMASDSAEGAFTGSLVSLTQDLQTINWMPRQSAIPVRIARRLPS